MALVPYFSAHPAAPEMRHRLLAALQQCKDPVVSRDALLLRAGLSFFADDLNVDLALMQFVREGWLVPISDRPFTFPSSSLLQKPPSDACHLFQIGLAASDRRLRAAAAARTVPIQHIAERLLGR